MGTGIEPRLRPHPLHDDGLARLMLSHAYREVAEWALGGIATHVDAQAEPGSFVEEALRMLAAAEDVLRWAVTTERERGTGWDELDLLTRTNGRPAASLCFDVLVEEWREALEEPETVRVDGSAADPRIPYPASSPEEGAGRLDNWLLERTVEGDPWFGTAQPVSRHLHRHSTLSAMMHAGRYSTRLLCDQLVPPPAAQADACDLQADLAERLAREVEGAYGEMTEFAVLNRTRAAMLRSLPGEGIRWDEVDRPSGTAVDYGLLAAETTVLEKIEPFLAEDVYVLTPGEIRVFRDLQEARAAQSGEAAAAVRPGAQAIARTLISADRTFYYARSDAGEVLYFALRSYLSASGDKHPGK
ncbi:hypothetical protein [Kitasatospora kifunensis]|uniref:Uncharacterized protein n=1 Tax=Kitasatospora kifunensis TaxID=58351 RepID=A0A7W7RBT7_KITKI|nr:hypothetical protein [Kitasatospora kifunensis]MBB4929125.1 hypothetical protein [Kitasatospora kifunensis]